MVTMSSVAIGVTAVFAVVVALFAWGDRAVAAAPAANVATVRPG